MDVEVVVVVAVVDVAIIAAGAGSITENDIGCIGCIGCTGGIGVCMEGTGTGCVTRDDCATGSNGEGENDSTEEIEDNVGRKVVMKI
jgi:hypothetical protein